MKFVTAGLPVRESRTSCAKVVGTRAQWMQKGSKDTQTPLLQVD